MLRRCRLTTREYQFREMALPASMGGDRVAATVFLQKNVHELVDHEDLKERRQVRRAFFNVLIIKLMVNLAHVLV